MIASLRILTLAALAAVLTLSFAPGALAQTAKIQATHASGALSSSGPIEVYINQDASSTSPDAEVVFRSGTAFLDVPAGQAFNVRARLKTQPPPGLPREVTFTAPALPPGTYEVSLVGIPEQIQAFFAQNPNGIDRDLQLVVAFFGELSSGRSGGPPPSS